MTLEEQVTQAVERGWGKWMYANGIVGDTIHPGLLKDIVDEVVWSFSPPDPVRPSEPETVRMRKSRKDK